MKSIHSAREEVGREYSEVKSSHNGLWQRTKSPAKIPEYTTNYRSKIVPIMLENFFFPPNTSYYFVEKITTILSALGVYSGLIVGNLRERFRLFPNVPLQMVSQKF